MLGFVSFWGKGIIALLNMIYDFFPATILFFLRFLLLTLFFAYRCVTVEYTIRKRILNEEDIGKV